MKSILSWCGKLPLFLALISFTHADEVSGLIIPRDNDGMYVRNEQGQFEIEWTSKTQVALVVSKPAGAGSHQAAQGDLNL